MPTSMILQSTLILLLLISIKYSWGYKTGGDKTDSSQMSSGPSRPSGTPTGGSGSVHGLNWGYSWGWGATPKSGWGRGSGFGKSPDGFGRGSGFGFGSGSGSGSGSGYGYGSGGARGGGHGSGGGGTDGNGGGAMAPAAIAATRRPFPTAKISMAELGKMIIVETS